MERGSAFRSLSLLALLAFALTACGGGRVQSSQGPGPGPIVTTVSPASPGPVPPTDQGPPTVSGHVTVGDTGEPYPGVSVEFKTVDGENVHTTTNADGYCSLPVP